MTTLALILTIMNIVLFGFSLFLLFRTSPLCQKRQRSADHAYAKAACERIAPVLAKIREFNIAGVEKVQNATASAIEQFSSLERRIQTTTGETRGILDLMREKIALGVAKDIAAEGPAPDSEAIRKRYAALFRSVLEQMSLITERKTEEISRLESVRNALARQDESTENAARRIGKTMADIQEAAVVEERLIISTLGILEDVVLSLVDSFIRINAIVEKTLGDSSSIGDEISTIMVNLQCEDLCQEMGELTLSNLNAVFKELKYLGVDWEENKEKCKTTETRHKEDGDDAEANVTFF